MFGPQMFVDWGPGAGPFWPCSTLAQLSFVDGVLVAVATLARGRRVVVATSSVVVVVAVPCTVLAVVAVAF